MKQIGLALHNDHDTHRCFPFNAGGVYTNVRGWILLLPFLDQAPLYAQYDFNHATGTYLGEGNCGGPGGYPVTTTAPYLAGTDAGVVANVSLGATIIPVFYCPSDPGERTSENNCTSHGMPSPRPRSARSCYEFSVATVNPGTHWTSKTVATRSMFGINSNCKIRDITDGTSNSIAVCEKLLETRLHNWASWSGTGWSNTGVSIQDTARPINERRCCSWDGFTSPAGVAHQLSDGGFTGSMHVGGLHILMGDGAVRFLSENIDYATRRDLSRIADDQVLGEF